MTGRDERNPLARALDEVSGGPEAQAFTISVEAVRAGARRRRARRTGVTSGLAALVVLAMAGGAYAGLPHRSGAQHGVADPGPAPSAQVHPDWPAQFLRCGQVVGDALPHLGGDVSLTVTDASSSIPADGPWSASVTADVPAAPAGSSAVVWGTDLSVVRNGVVIGVQEGPATPDLSWSLDRRLGPDGYLPTSPFPVTTQVTRALASCDQYPSGQGSPHLAPGSYTLVVTQTLSYATAPGANPTLIDVRSSVTTSVTVTAPSAGAGPSDLGATAPAIADPVRTGLCGATTRQLDALAAALPGLVVDNRTASVVANEDPFRFHVQASPSFVATQDSSVVLVRDGVVVGAGFVAEPAETGLSDAWDGPAVIYDCSRLDGVTPTTTGRYEMWLVSRVTLAGQAPARVARGPWEIQLSPGTAAPGPTAWPSPGP